MASKPFMMRAAMSLLGVWLVSGGSASAQSLAFEDDTIELLGPAGEVDTRLQRGVLRLGSQTPGAQPGLLILHDSEGNATFIASALYRTLEFRGGIYLRQLAGPVSAQLIGETGSLHLGTTGEDGDLVLYSSDGDSSVAIDGDTSTASNALAGNGFIKGWARIDSNGDVLSCYKCDADMTERPSLGTYYIDFSPIDDDITSRPRIAVLDKFGNSLPGVDTITVSDDDTGDTSRIRVLTGPAADHSFTITVF